MHDEHLRKHLRNGKHLREFALQEFLAAARTGRMIAFVGSYATEDLGYLKWKDFLIKYSGSFAIGSSPYDDLVSLAADKISGTAPSPPPTASSKTALIDLIIENWAANPGQWLADQNLTVEEALEKYREQLCENDFFGLGRATLVEGSAPYEIIESLGIGRVITTNYDLEFEWQFMLTAQEHAAAVDRRTDFQNLVDAGKIVRHEDTGGLSRRLPSGRTTHSDVFDRGRTDRLIEFAVGAPNHYGHVLHLHGRATAKDANGLIVGLGDYERQYRKSGIAKVPFEHALKLLYAGNPVIFIGNGMAEPEVTNTLENFVSDNLRNRLAPAFVLWSPQADETNAANIKLGPEDELRRIEWYRRFGVFTIYDCDLGEKFDREAAARDIGAGGAPRRVSHAVRALGAYGKQHIPSFKWERRHMRTTQWRYDFGDGCADPERFDVWRCQPLIAKEDDLLQVFSSHGKPTPEPGLVVSNTKDSEHFATLFRGAPVKAIINPPGDGHGYLAKVIAHAFSSDLGDLIKTRASVVNAGFVCEIDSTFSLISGLYDGITAFGRKPGQAKSRQAALLDLELALSDLSTTSVLEHHLLLVINGMDRFFETSGYPLSNELDNMVRKIVQTYRKRFKGPHGKDYSIHDWVKASDTVNPYTVILLGTPRILRYLEGLGWIRQTDAMFDEVRAGTREHPGDYAVLGGHPHERGHALLDFIKGKNEELWKSRKPNKWKLFQHEPGDAHSNYLALVQDRMKLDLSPARDARRDRGKARGVGDLRHGVLDAYLRTDAIRQALGAAREGLADLCLDLLSSLSFFGQPIDRCVFDELPRVKSRLPDTGTRSATVSEAIAALVDLGLMLTFPAFPETPKGGFRYGIHRTVMAELRNRYGVPISDAKLSAGFNLSLFASQLIDDYTPEQDIHCDLGEVVDQLIDACNGLREKDPSEAGRMEPGAYLRAAMLLMRNYFTTSALLMLEPPPNAPEDFRAPLTQHAERLEKLIKAGEMLAQQRAEMRDGNGPTPVFGAEAFFPDDLVWLHNEFGVVKLVQGDLYKARFAFEAARTLNRKHVEFDDKLQNWRRLELNQLQLDIERGKLSSAESRILDLERAVNEHVGAFRIHDAAVVPGAHGMPAAQFPGARVTRPPASFVDEIIQHYGSGPRERTRVVDPQFPADAILTVGLLTGYRGLCAYLRGNFKVAAGQFDASVEILRNIGEQRGSAIFLRHRASLLHAMGSIEACDESSRIGLAAADSVRQMDLGHLYRIGEVAQATSAGEIAPDQHPATLQKIMAALHYSVQADMFRVRIEARQALAEMRAAAGDYDSALEHAADALAVATRFGFGLRKINLRILIGRILLKRGDPKSGNALLNQAIINADRVGFQRAVERAQSVRYRYSQLYRP